MIRMTKEEISDAIGEITIPLLLYGIDIDETKRGDHLVITVLNHLIWIGQGLSNQEIVLVGYRYTEERTRYWDKRSFQYLLARTICIVLIKDGKHSDAISCLNGYHI
jgi:hypothetical protein